MAKTYYCAGCGLELLVHRKAYPKQQKIVDVVEPHKCSESGILEPSELKPIEAKKTVDLNEIFDSFKFVSKLNGLEEKTEKPEVLEDPPAEFIDGVGVNHLRDRRPKEDLRTSTAPRGILGTIDNLDSSQAEKPMVEPESEKGG
jgi:hypothetical protein